MELFNNLALGFSTASSLENLFFCLIGVLLGTLILAVIDSGLGAMGAKTDVLNTVKGGIIILAVAIEYFRNRGRMGRSISETN